MFIFRFIASLFNEHVILLRIVVYTFGWVTLSISTIIVLYRTIKFYQKSKHSSLSKLILPLMFGWLITMYSLGIVCTFYVFDMPRKGMLVTLPIFFIWMVTIMVVYIITSKWGIETIKQYDETIKLNTELQEKVKELKKFNKLAIGRELRMIELKKQVKNSNKEK